MSVYNIKYPIQSCKGKNIYGPKWHFKIWFHLLVALHFTSVLPEVVIINIISVYNAKYPIQSYKGKIFMDLSDIWQVDFISLFIYKLDGVIQTIRLYTFWTI